MSVGYQVLYHNKNIIQISSISPILWFIKPWGFQVGTYFLVICSFGQYSTRKFASRATAHLFRGGFLLSCKVIHTYSGSNREQLLISGGVARVGGVSGVLSRKCPKWILNWSRVQILDPILAECSRVGHLCNLINSHYQSVWSAVLTSVSKKWSFR